MGVIRIREKTAGPDGWNVAVSFDYGPEHNISICDPFTQAQEQQLEWYFEKYPQYPYMRHIRASEAANSITAYGESLFSQVFSGNLISQYKAHVQSGLQTLRIEIAGSPRFHVLHWEALKDPEFPLPLALLATIVRQNLTPPPLYASLHASPTVNLLIVTARPHGKDDPAGYRTISRPLVEELHDANLRVQIDILRPGTYKALDNHLRSNHVGHYHGIHLDLHGKIYTYEQLQQGQKSHGFYQLQRRHGRQSEIQPYEGMKAFLLFESEEDNKADLVEAKELKDLLINYQILITILNACQSGKQMGDLDTSLGSHLMQAGVQLVVAMGYSVNIRAAELLMNTLYQQLFENEDLSAAIRTARAELHNDKVRMGFLGETIDLEDWFLPIIYQNQTQPLKLSVRDFTLEEELAYYERRAEEESNTPEIRYKFVGRDTDILQIEKRLLIQRNILLIRGIGGVGKTHLMHYLGDWWHTTGLVKQVFYFGYDEQAWTLSQIMDNIAKRLFDPNSYRTFSRAAPLIQQAMLEERLRQKNHLLILDNLESITGAGLAIQHPLPPEEQTALRNFLSKLFRGHTFVLLGSRDNEERLSSGTFENNIYDLSGLDYEAASALANRILKEQHNEHYREDEDFHKLLRLLGGFPLAIEVVLANLARQTPKQVLADLQARDDNPNSSDIHDKAARIMHCINYSHSNLAPELQELLLCLTPFKDLVQQDFLITYLAYLQQEPALGDLPFEIWSKVLREARNGGILQPDHDDSSILHIQPMFTYFLRCRLGAPEQVEKKEAIEIAFRRLYEQTGKNTARMLSSLSLNDRQEGQKMIGLEYGNLITALHLALKARGPVLGFFNALTAYLNIIKEKQKILELSQETLKGLQAYPSDKLTGPIGLERALITDTLAGLQTDLGKYVEAEDSYSQELEFLSQVKDIDEEERSSLQAISYHNLGNLALKQHNWQKAEDYFKQSLNIKLVLDNSPSLAPTYQQLSYTLTRQGKLQEAEEYSRLALQVFTQINGQNPNQTSQADTPPHLGTREQLQPRQPITLLDNEALRILFNNSSDMAKAYQHLGSLALEEKQWTLAETYYRKSLVIYIEAGEKKSQDEITEQLDKIVKLRQKGYDNLLLSLEAYMIQNDTPRNISLWIKLAQLWHQSDDVDLLATMASRLNTPMENVEVILRRILEYIADVPSFRNSANRTDQ